MMDAVFKPSLEVARGNAVEAGRILSLLKLPIGGGHHFTALVSLYHDMLDPKTTDERQLAACLVAERFVDAHIIVETSAAGQREPTSRYRDPYRLEYRAGQRGALLEICAARLAEARRGFKAAAVKPMEPYSIIIG